MYDIASLFDASSNFEDVYKSYMDTVNTEIKYRDIDITYEAALMDTIDVMVQKWQGVRPARLSNIIALSYIY